MAHHKSALKRIKTAEKARLVNRKFKTSMKNAIKSVLNAENKETAAANLKSTASLLDKMAGRNIIHKNKAANQKSRLTRFVNSLN